MIKNIRDCFHYLFIPSEKNNFRAKTIQHDFLTYYLAVAFLFVFIIRGFGGTVSHILGIATDITVDKLLEYTNQERQRNNLPVLSYNQKLSDAASRKAEDMLAKNYWAHFSPDGGTPWDFVSNSAVAPRITPAEPFVTPQPQEAIVAAAATKNSASPQLAFSGVSAKVAYAFILFLTIAIAIDFFVASRLDIVRLHGKSLAHFIFLFTLYGDSCTPAVNKRFI